MDENAELEKIKTQPQSSDVKTLLSILEKKDQEIHRLKKKNEILHQQNMELTQEMESIRSDFGDRR